MADNVAKIVITAVDGTAVALNSIRNNMDSVKGAAHALGVTLSAAGFAAFIKGSIDAADNINDLSQRLGVSIKDLSAWKLISEQSGTSMETLGKAVKSASVYYQQHSDKLQAAGITAKTANGIITQMADVFASLPDGLEKTNLAISVFGQKIGPDLIPALNLGSKGIQEAIDKTAAYAAKMEELAPQADKFNDNLAELKLSSSALGINMATILMPALTDISTAMAIAAREGGLLNAAMVGLGGIGSYLFTDDNLSALEQVDKKIKAIREDIQAYNPLAIFGPNIETLRKELSTLEAQRNSLQKAIDAAAKKPGSDKPPMSPEEAHKRAQALIDQSEAAKKAAEAYKSVTQSIGEYQATLDAQADKQGKLTKAEELGVQAKTKLTAAQYAALKPKLDALAADERMVTLTEAVTKREQERFDTEAKTLESIKDQVQAQRDQNETIGLTKEQIDNLEASRLDALITSKQTLLAYYDENDIRDANVEVIRQEVEALKDLRDAKRDGAIRQASADAVKRVNDDLKSAADAVTRTLADAIMDGGMDGGKLIKNYFKTLVLTPLLQPITNGVTSAIGSAIYGNGAGIPGASGGGIGGGLDSLSSLANLASLSNIPSLGTAVGNLSSSYATFTTMMSEGSSFFDSASAALAGTGSSFAAVSPYIGAALQLAQGNVSGAAFTAGGAFLGNMILPGIGGVIGGALGGVVGSLFGGGGSDPHNNAQITNGFQGSLSRAGASGSIFNAGPTSGNGWWADSSALSTAQKAAVDAQISGLFSSGSSLAMMLGRDPSIVNSASISSAAQGTSNGHLAPYFTSIDQALSALSDTIITKVIPNIKDFQQTSETLAQTADRLGQEFSLTNTIALMMGKNAAKAIGSLANRDSLVQSLGGMSNASSSISGYYQNFYSDAERNAATKTSIGATLAALGIKNAPTTREQFRALVEAQDLTTDAGRKMYATLISISDAFAGITQAATGTVQALNFSTNLFKTRADYDFANTTGILPHYASGGAHSGGWAIVGERGPELANLGPSRVYSNTDSSSLLDMSGLLKQMASIQDDVGVIGATLAEHTRKTKEILDKWEKTGMPPERAAL